MDKENITPKGKCGYVPARIKLNAPFQCPAKAVIPLVEVLTEEDTKPLSSCFVYVQSVNKTYYIDDTHRFILCWAGMLFKDGYDYETNPLGIRNQIVPDFQNNRVIIFNNAGEALVVGEGGASVDSISDEDWEALWA